MTKQTIVFAFFLLHSLPATAVTVSWTDWTASSTTANPNTATGTLVFGANNVTVNYTGQIAFTILAGGTNYWTEPDAGAKPYTGGEVENAPPAADIIAMSSGSTRTLAFSEAVSDLYFAYVSMNGNGFTFDRDFDIVSQGTGYWGGGSAQKVDNGNGTYSLNALSGEPHGIIKLKGSFTAVTWTSAANEYWYGFTVGAVARTIDLPPTGEVPEPATFALAGAALGMVALRRKK